MDSPLPGGGFLYTFWHRYIIPLAHLYRKQDVGIIISESFDGELIARTVKRLGYLPIRGSSSRGGSRALIALINELQGGRVCATTPDGPRGPRYTMSAGTALAAMRAEVPVVPIAVFASSAWFLKSWDKAVIPKPCVRVLARTANPIYPGDFTNTDTMSDAIRNELLSLETALWGDAL